MRLEQDFTELLELFNRHDVAFCVVGAFALAFHAHPRYTKDMDLLVEPSRENGQRVVNALAEFGFASLSLKAEDFIPPERVIQLGYPPLRVDLITSLSGVTFAEVWRNRVAGHYGEVPVSFISKDDLLKAKSSTGRPQDTADAEYLRRSQELE